MELLHFCYTIDWVLRNILKIKVLKKWFGVLSRPQKSLKKLRAFFLFQLFFKINPTDKPTKQSPIFCKTDLRYLYNPDNPLVTLWAFHLYQSPQTPAY